TAYACFEKFIDKYLHNFFFKDNSIVIKEYLGIFNSLIAFHDPRLYLRMLKINFDSELFAIPWFLTVFAHILPLPKIFHLWDAILLKDETFPLFISLALLNVLRGSLMSSGFNEAILLFSDFSDIDIENCIQTANKYYRLTPDSFGYRLYGSKHFIKSKKFPLPYEIGIISKYR
ncbi:unnamed protein product, partial [Gordionus sp. m RMFG-2023]